MTPLTDNRPVSHEKAMMSCSPRSQFSHGKSIVFPPPPDPAAAPSTVTEQILTYPPKIFRSPQQVLDTRREPAESPSVQLCGVPFSRACAKWREPFRKQKTRRPHHANERRQSSRQRKRRLRVNGWGTPLPRAGRRHSTNEAYGYFGVAGGCLPS